MKRLIIAGPIIPQTVCAGHDGAMAFLLGIPCPRCGRKSLFATDYGA